MNSNIANQIAKLLNSNNQLVKKYTENKVLETKDNYVYIVKDSTVIACAESKKVQWYQSEISHLSVSEKFQGEGYAKKILTRAESKAIEDGAKIIQCTIRKDNKRSISLFKGFKYSIVNEFYYNHSGNWVLVLQKTIHK